MTPGKLTTLIITAALMISCSGPKKTSSLVTPAGKSASPDNPTLEKANYSRLDRETFLLEGVSDDKTYGYSPQNAIKVGIAKNGESGPANERSYLNALLGPEGQKVTYKRLGGCCPVESKNGMMGMAMLDKYEVTYEGLDQPVYLYLNMYDPGRLFAPAGFTYHKTTPSNKS